MKRMLDGDFANASWNLAMARKDTRLMMEAADEGGTPLKFIPAAAAEMDRWLAQGHAADDWTIIAKPVVK
jgi:3-hydroxyisobutyrate dehydrogenase